MIINMSGGGGKVFAVVGVTYPAGSVCTCTNGSKKLTAKDASGQALFAIPSAGEWTVAATSADGSKTKSTPVSITAEGQVETVELTYELVLFDNGVVNDIKWDENETSGNYEASSSVNKKIHLQASGIWDDNFYSSSAFRGTSDAYDLSPYSTLKITVSAVNDYGEKEVIIGTSALGDDVLQGVISTKGVAAYDISAINRRCFISFYAEPDHGENGTATVDITKVWLE